MQLKGKIINFLGDSITEGAGVTNSENIYLNVLKKEENLTEVRNYGVSGTRISRQIGGDYKNNPVDADFIYRAQNMEDNADIIVVFGGTNDYGHGNAPLGNFDDSTPYSFYGACHSLMKLLINKYPQALIVFMLPLHRLNEDEAVYEYVSGDPAKEDAKKPLKFYNEAIKEVAYYYGIPVLDLAALCPIQPAIEISRKKYIPDGLHPNDEGHKIIAHRLAGFLKSL